MATRSRVKKRHAADVLSARAGADEALDALVGQFSDPYAFLRELVQNSLDAGSTCIDVSFEHRAEQGLAAICVADNGEGMNERVIDKHLLTLFSSTKENDLTKIGKFGIGFVSIFAIAPDLVILETGQAGEAWRLIFHADAGFEKLALDDEIIEGTTVTLLKAASVSDVEEIRRRGSETVRYWCKFAEAEITIDGESARAPFEIDAPLAVRHSEPGTEIVVGPAPLTAAEPASVAQAREFVQVSPLVGLYNRGLTLLEGSSLPGGANDLVGLSCRIKSRYLEHTLTRDNVLLDESYDKAIDLLRAQVSDRLRPLLFRHVEAAARRRGRAASAPRTGSAAPASEAASEAASETASEISSDSELDSLSLADALLYARLPALALHRYGTAVPAFPVIGGDPLTITQLRKLRTPVGVLLFADAANPLTEVLAAEGVTVLAHVPGLAEYLHTVLELRAVPARAMLHTALPVQAAGCDADLLAATARHLDRAGCRLRALHLGDFEYADSHIGGELMLRQQRAYGASQIDERPSIIGGAREIVINVRHALVAQCRELAARDLVLASQLLAQGVGVEDGLELDRCAAIGRDALATARRHAESSGG